MTGDLHYFHPGTENPDACSKCGMGMHENLLPVGAKPSPTHEYNDRGICDGHPQCVIEAPNNDHMKDQGVKSDAHKLPFHLLPVVPLEDVTQVLLHGAEKYQYRNWEKGLAWSRVYSATLRHLFAWWKGEDLDQDSGLPHLAHAACNILYLLEFRQTHPDLDDRPNGKGGAK